MKRSMFCAVLALILSSASFGAMSFTEAFDNGTGVFTETSGSGATDYVWNSVDQNISATTVRSDTGNQLYVPLDQTYDVHTTIATFSALITPVSTSNITWSSIAQIGFFSSEDLTSVNKLLITYSQSLYDAYANVRGRYTGGEQINYGAAYEFGYGQPYFTQVYLNGAAGYCTTDIYTVNDGVYVLVWSDTIAIDSDEELTFDSFGITNTMLDGTGTGSVFNFEIDDVSLCIKSVPEPATMVLLGLGGVLLRRKAVK